MAEQNTTTDSSNSVVSTTLLDNITNVATDLSSVIYEATTGTSFTEPLESNQTGLNTTAVKIMKIIANLTGIISTTAKTTGSGLLNSTTKTTICSTTTTEEPFDEFGPPEGVEYIFVPLGVMLFVIILSAVVLVISRKRKLERLRHRLMPLYNFDPGEEGEDDWETELLDEGFDNRQKRQGYRSMDTEENAELFSGH